ncbi:dolichyl-phosphate-mannose-protein mannosyltransferase [Desulfobotulus alkaliphilus]|uniref:Dolichyl-phosphate-mannose-protein mannosyltransferase n=1 Tax=Desulfobotulus alkaliphilus TaxID=622671 RepID=A0A562RZ14_9BACT|nr:glycosyltransferase family 39 protein [Desulfobotulus alkaliphilus]TWI74387.1 dolichyl-phosphate-mannose-protein mannosyltransferase [Desulfobotulus alkaliphilus]
MPLTRMRPFTLALWIITLFTLLRFFHAGAFMLVPDETNYWQWGRHLDWGYHDQAPMIGWLIRFFCEIMGHTERAVRMPSILGMALAGLYMVLTARRWFGEEAALGTALITQSVLLFQVGGILATSDGIQAAAWAGATYHVARAYEENSWSQWLWGGFWFGFGLLSKFTMVLFGFFALAYGLGSKIHRKRLTGIRPWVAVILGSLMFMPVIFWNHSHNWNSLRHVAHLGGAGSETVFTLKYFFEYLGSEIGLITPLIFLLVIMAWFAAFRNDAPGKPWIRHYLLATSLPMILFFALLSLKTRIYGNWPAAGYLGAAVLAAAFFSHGARVPEAPIFKKGRKIWPWAIGSGLLLTGLLLVHVLYPILPIPPDKDRSAIESSGWDDLGQRVAAMAEEMPVDQDTFFFGFRYQIASELAFYMPGQPRTVSINRWHRPNVYDYWWKDADILGKNAIGVSRHPDFRQRLLEVFEHVDEPEVFSVMRRGEKVRELFIYRCYGFKGGLRWQPSRPDDVRARG